MRQLVSIGTVVLALSLFGSTVHAAAHAPTMPSDVTSKDEVKAYLLATIQSGAKGAADLKEAGAEYEALVRGEWGSNGCGSIGESQQETADLILRMRDAYERIDSCWV